MEDSVIGKLRRDLQEGESGDLWRRRAIIGVSLLGAAAMAVVALFQTGIVDHLPDPPLDGFDSDDVTSSDVGYAIGGADAAFSMASLAVNVPIAAYGTADRVNSRPLIPIAFAGKAVSEAAIAGWFFYQMAAKEKKWCGYCIVNAAAIWSIAFLSLPEEGKAFGRLIGQKTRHHPDSAAPAVDD